LRAYLTQRSVERRLGGGAICRRAEHRKLLSLILKNLTR
jgi:hypothetical protein